MDGMAWIVTIWISLFVLAIVNTLYRVYRAKRKPNKLETGLITASGLCILGGVVGFLGQYVLCIAIMVTTTLLVYFLRPAMQEREITRAVESMKNVDITEPLRFRDFFSSNFIPKLEKKYGEHKALRIYLTIWASFAIVVTPLIWFLLDALIFRDASGYMGMAWPGMIPTMILVIIVTIFTIRRGCLNTREALKRSEQQLPPDNY
jgi:preprotein translocase subunit Sss1